MGFWDVPFLPFRVCFSTTFLKNYGKCESFMTTTCLPTVVGGKQGHATCKILLFQHNLFLCHSNFMEIIKLSQSLGESCHLQFWLCYRI